ncbi:MAG: hypothetical protein QOD54_539 [Sphingomonadales bacterium]|nr:hypothetical protein [Sphingomonadales bacterium]
MVMELAAREPFRLGNATIDPVSREARWEGGQERLQPQTLKVLIALAAKRGEVVTRDELVELCWDGRIVGDDVINRSISLLRQFAEHAGGFAIETVPRAGYRLIENGHRVSAGRTRRLAIAGAAIISLVAAIAIFALSHRPPPSTTLRIAVEPFAYDRGDENSRRLAGQVADASIRMLTETGVSVSRLERDRTTGARADFVLSGSITGSGNRSAATVTLDDPLRHAVVLSRQISAEPNDPDALPDQVGAQLSAALSWVAPLLRLDREHPSDPAVIANLLDTNQTSFDSQRAFQRARRVAQGAPDSAIAQLALAMSTGLNVMVIPTAERSGALASGRAAAARAIRLAPDFGDVYIPWCMLHAEARIAECEASLRHGLAADPNAPSVLSTLGILLRNVGRLDEALPIAAESLARSPYGPGKMANSLIALEASGQSDDAEALFRRGHRLWPHYGGLFLKRVGGLTARGDFDALSRFDQQVRASGLFPHYPSLARPLALAVRERSLSVAQAACRQPADDDLPVIQCMLALARLGDLDEAFRLADRLYPRRTAGTAAEEDAIWFANPDNLDTIYLTASGAAPLRRDPRYLALADRVGLSRYWRKGHLPDFCTRYREPICRAITKS